jgi:ribonuclease HI
MLSLPMKNVTLYTDGGCIRNPGPGGYGTVLIYGDHRKELSGGFRATTNNRMEIYAAIAGLEAIKEHCSVTVCSDSQYLVNAIQKGWAKRWQANGWKRNKRERAINPDLWERLLELCEKHTVRFEWVRGHAGEKENERCDKLAGEAARGAYLAIDEGYEKESPYKHRMFS